MDDVSGFIPDGQFTPDAPVASNGASGFIPDDQFQSDEDKYGTPGQMAITAVEGAAHGVAGPLATIAEKHILGVPEADIRGRQEANPITHGIGQAVGLGGGLLTGTGEAALMTKAGELAAGAVGLGKGLETANLGYKVGSAAVQQAAEMAVLQSGDEVSKMILHDPSASAESALSNIGLAAALGGATGAAVEGTVKPLWNATAGPKVNEMLSKVANHLNGDGRAILPEAVDQAVTDLGINLSPEMKSAISSDPNLREHFVKLKYAQNPHVMASIDTFHKDVSEGVMKALNTTPEEIAAQSENEAGHELLNKFQKEYKDRFGDLHEQFTKRNAEANKIRLPDAERSLTYDKLLSHAIENVGTDSPQYKLYQEWGNRMLAKDTLGGIDALRTELGNDIRAAKSAVDFNKMNALQDIRERLGTFQENQILKQSALIEKEGAESGMALGKDLIQERQELNKRYAEFAKMSNELSDHLGTGEFYGKATLENKLANKISPEQLLNKFSFKNNADFIPFLEKNFPETLAEVQRNELKKFLKPALLGAKEGTPINVNKINDLIEKGMYDKKEYIESILPQGAIEKIKAGRVLTDAIPNPKDSGTPGGLAKILENMPSSVMGALGAMAGHGAGHITGGISGMLMGEMTQRLGKDMPEALRLGWLKYMGSNQPIKAEGFKAMVDFFHNTYKGENLLSKATSNVFKAGAQVIGTHLIPDSKDREKLDKAVTRLQNNPGQTTQTAMQQDGLGHYLPNHQMAMTEASTRALQYLQGLKPHPYRPNPLDKEIPPSKAQEARYHRALDIAQQPAIVLQHVKDGTLQGSDIQDLNALYPALYKNLSQKLSNEMTSAHSKEEPLPYKTRMGISLFLGQPVDSSMIPSSIMAAQPKPPQQNPQQGPSKGSGGKSMKSLGKTNKTYETPLQASERDRGDRS